MVNFGLPPSAPVPAFFAVDPHEGGGGGGGAPADSPLRYVVRAEDAIRDLVYAVLASPGAVRGGGAARTCRASTVTRPFPCMASLRHAQPWRFSGRDGGGAPLPAARGGPLLVDMGFTSAGYYATLATSLGVSALAVDTQPQCSMWARLAARANGADVAAYAAVALPPAAVARGAAAAAAAAAGASVRAPLRTGCLTTSTLEGHAARADVARWYSASAPQPADDASHGEAAAVAARSRVGTEGGAPGSAAAATDADAVAIPLAAGDDILCAVYPGFCGGDASADAGPTPAIILLKIDARGYETAAVDGLARTLASPATAPLNVVIELNKQHTAVALGLPSAVAAGAPAPAPATDDALVAGVELPSFALSAEDNAAVADRYIALVQRMLRLGYEGLSSDRGWFAAQDPFSGKQAGDEAAQLHDGTSLRSWAEKAAVRGEIDLWFYRPGENAPA